MKEVGYVLFALYALLSLWLFSSAVMQLWLWRLSKRKIKSAEKKDLNSFPFVSIQVPVYNERYAIAGLLDSLSRLRYPRQCYEVLVLDDSTDDTSILIDQKVASLTAEGLSIKVVRRKVRSGYKAGALQESLPLCKGNLVAVFDADFRPYPDFLERLLPHFSDSRVGLVQARWEHINQQQNSLTRIQSFLLDTYFSVEMKGRYKGDCLINFCGTAGIWRKDCIQAAGGWDGDVLSEDLDLSYRAQLQGWKLIYDHSTTVPAELPAVMEAFKVQQARWTKGIMQVFRKNWKRVAASPLSFVKKLFAFFHLTGSFVFPCLLFNSLLSLPLLLLRHAVPEFVGLTNVAAIGGLNLVFLTAVFYQGVKSTGRENNFLLYYPLFLVVYMGMAVQNTLAVLQGMAGHRSPFVRTPKFAGEKPGTGGYMQQKISGMLLLEAITLLYFLAGIGLSFYLEDYFFLLLFVMMSSGLSYLLYHTISWRKTPWSLTLPKLSWR